MLKQKVPCKYHAFSNGEIDYEVQIRGSDFTGFCKNSVIADPVVSSWIHKKKCPSPPLPSTLTKPSRYTVVSIVTAWTSLSSTLPPCTAGWILSWPGEYETIQIVAIPDGTTVDPSTIPNSFQEPGLYKQLQATRVSPGLNCGCAPNPGSTLALQYGGSSTFACF